MELKHICIVVCAFFSLCDSAFVDTFKKCSWKDDKCTADVIKNAITYVSENGIQEFNVPPTDPMNLTHMFIPISGLFNITLDEGQLKGLKDCVIVSVHNNLTIGQTNMEMICDLTIKAKFKLEDLAPAMKNLLGQNFNTGSGSIKIKIEKLNMKMRFFYHLVRKADGDVYFKCHTDEFQYKFEIGNFKVKADKILFGTEDVSDLLENFLNQNWVIVMPTFGQGMINAAMDVALDYVNTFFENAPAKIYIIEDLSSFVTN